MMIDPDEAEQLENATIPEDNFRADVEAAYKAVSEKSETTEDGPSRDATGKFAPRSEEPEIKAEGAETSDTPKPDTDADPAPAMEQQPSKAVEPPKGWSADAKAKWSTLDPSIQAEVAKREADIDNGGRQWSEQRRAYDEVLAPVKGLASRNGVDEREAITRLVQASEWLEKDPRAFLTSYAQHYGINLTLADQQPNRPQSQPDPYIAQLHETVQRIEGTLASQQEKEINSVIQTFASSPGHEHFDTVKVEMGRLMQIDPSLSMDDAYDKAIWSNKDIRANLLAAQAPKPDSRDKERQQTAKAKASAVSPKGSGPNGAAPVPKKEYGDDIRSIVADAYYGRT